MMEWPDDQAIMDWFGIGGMRPEDAFRLALGLGFLLVGFVAVVFFLGKRAEETANMTTGPIGEGEEASATMITMASGVSHRTGDGFITYRWGAMACQFTPDEARQHALALIASAEAAEFDAAFNRFGIAKLNIEPAHAAMMLQEFRNHRRVNG